MAFFGSELNVALVTRHQPLRNVPEVLTREKVVSTVRTLVNYFENRRDRSPSLALLGLNPHAGEEGRLGNEDLDLLKPAVNSLRNDGIDIEGPVPADGYLPVQGTSVDVVVACYHDQGLIPFKQKHFFDGVHATLGLPVNRVSPDHGIAADRAQSGNVDSTSTMNCLRWLRGEPPHEA
jgi:4-hydroxy-L-threonine phosphate dehydrogenase PdxA